MQDDLLNSSEAKRRAIAAPEAAKEAPKAAPEAAPEAAPAENGGNEIESSSSSSSSDSDSEVEVIADKDREVAQEQQEHAEPGLQSRPNQTAAHAPTPDSDSQSKLRQQLQPFADLVKDSCTVNDLAAVCRKDFTSRTTSGLIARICIPLREPSSPV